MPGTSIRSALRWLLLGLTVGSAGLTIVLVAQLQTDFARRSRLEDSIATLFGVGPRRPPASDPSRNWAPARDPRLTDYRYVLERVRREDMPRNLAAIVVTSAFSDGAEYAELTRKQQRREENLTDFLRRTELEQELWADLERFLGFPHPLNGPNSQYGDLPREKVAQIEWFRRLNRRMPEAADLRGILTADELHDFERYNSAAANSIKFLLDPVDVLEGEYLQLVDSALARHKANPRTGDPAGLRHVGAALAPVLRELHQVLGDTRFLRIANSLAPRPFSIDSAYRDAGIPEPQRVALFFRAQEFDQQLKLHEDSTRSHPMGSASQPGIAQPLTRPRVEAAYRSFTTEAGLNRGQIAAFDQTELGGVLKRLIAELK